MESVRIFFSDDYLTDAVEPGMRSTFDVMRGCRVREALLASRRATRRDFHAPEPISDEMLRLVHTDAYLASLNDPAVVARLLLLDPRGPWDERLLRPFLVAAGGTLAAARFAAIHDAIGFNLGGGFHHAQADKGEGFCPIADVAIAIRALRREGMCGRVLIIDLDYHHGNGNAEIFATDESVFTFSLHANNWCWIDKRNHLDVELPAGTADASYLAEVERHVPSILDRFRPDFVAYVAGADPFCEDMLGDFAVSEQGMLVRDRLVTTAVRERGLPLLVVTAGGYGPTSWRIVHQYLDWLLRDHG